MIEAAGGLVFNKDGDILMIFRNGKWDLPKGKLEIGESVEECAIREVEEECSIVGLYITEKIIETYHTYSLKGEEILKRTYWYKMRTNFDGELSPQIEEGITKVSWIDKDQISEKIKNSYGNISDVLKIII
jgi:8-oxo-dGTP pyrophosphatase MutT (NUDIX family)